MVTRAKWPAAILAGVVLSCVSGWLPSEALARRHDTPETSAPTRQARGYYREYTVPTPGEYDRGARRIVCGGKDDRQPETCFYTRDHYQSFQEIDPRR